MVRLETIERMIQEAVSDWKGLPACAYQGADDPTYTMYVTGDATQYLSLGMRIKLTQTTDKFFILTGIGSYDSGNNRTLLTMYGGTDYDLANTTIVNPSYSSMKAPLGFPTSPLKWTEVLEIGSSGGSNYVDGTAWGNVGLTLAVPIGAWELGYQVNLGLYIQSGNYLITNYGSATLSTSASTETNSEYTARIHIQGTYTTTINQRLVLESPITRYRYKVLESKTTFYLLVGNSANVKSRVFANIGGQGCIKAVCAYL